MRLVRYLPAPRVHEAEHPVVHVLPGSNERALLLGISASKSWI